MNGYKLQPADIEQQTQKDQRSKIKAQSHRSQKRKYSPVHSFSTNTFFALWKENEYLSNTKSELESSFECASDSSIV